jgi:putative transposase
MGLMGLEADFPGKKTTIPNQEHRIYPYLLRGVEVMRPNQVWSADITYIPLREGRFEEAGLRNFRRFGRRN